MKLYYFPGACPLVTHIVLEWLGKPYEAVKMTREQTKDPEYLALNPTGTVPTLVDGDFVLSQSAAILDYLAEINPQTDLIGADARSRAETRRWLSFCNSDVHRTFGLLFGGPFYSDGDEKIAGVLAKQATGKLISYFALMNDQLKGKDWLTGQRSIADPYLFVLMRWCDFQKIDLSGFTELMRFKAKMEQDAGVRAALKAEGLLKE